MACHSAAVGRWWPVPEGHQSFRSAEPREIRHQGHQPHRQCP